MSALQTFQRIAEDLAYRRKACPRAASLLDRIHEAKQDATGQKLTDLESMRIAVAGFVVYGKDCTEEGERYFSGRLDKLTGDNFVQTPTTGYAMPEEGR